jgi:CHAT domain-containing protein
MNYNYDEMKLDYVSQVQNMSPESQQHYNAIIENVKKLLKVKK